MQRLEKQLELVDQALEENNDRINVMHEHLRNVQQELTYTESRVSPLTISRGINWPEAGHQPEADP